MNVYCRLVIRSGGENLALFGRNRRISLDQLSGYAAQSLDGQGQRSYVQKQYIVNFTSQYAGLDSCTDSYALIRIDSLERFFTCNAFYGFLNRRNSG